MGTMNKRDRDILNRFVRGDAACGDDCYDCPINDVCKVFVGVVPKLLMWSGAADTPDCTFGDMLGHASSVILQFEDEG